MLSPFSSFKKTTRSSIAGWLRKEDAKETAPAVGGYLKITKHDVSVLFKLFEQNPSESEISVGFALWLAKERASDKAPHFTGSITVPVIQAVAKATPRKVVKVTKVAKATSLADLFK